MKIDLNTSITKEEIIKKIEEYNEKAPNMRFETINAKLNVLVELLVGYNPAAYFQDIRDIYDLLEIKYEVEGDMIYRLDDNGVKVTDSSN